MSLTFPITPSLNQTYTYGDVTYTWDGIKWVAEFNSAAQTDNINTLPLIGGTMSGSISVGTDNLYDLGTPTNQWKSIYGHTIEATYADLAERYEIDIQSEVGTVVIFGGDKEITPCFEDEDISVAGVISTNPAFKMNSNAGDDNTHPYVALRGRVPCKVIGPVRKGDLLVTSDTTGVAKSVGKTPLVAGFAKSLVDDLSDGIRLIEVVIV